MTTILHKSLGYLFIISSFFLFQCGETATTSAPSPPSASIPSWMGTYEGTFPCFDCSGINTQLTLEKDQHYVLKQHAIGTGEAPHVQQGHFEWNLDQTTIRLDTEPALLFLVESDALVHLDADGQLREGAFKALYTLPKLH